MRHFILLALLFFSSTAFGHNPNVANFSVRKLSESWVLTAEFSKEKAVASIQNEHQDSIDIAALSETELKEKIIQHMKSHVEIILNDSLQIVLGAGGIKMHDHHVEVILKLENLPTSIDSFEVFSDAFSDGKNHHNIFIWMDTKFILNKQNNFRLHNIRNKDQMKKRNPLEKL